MKSPLATTERADGRSTIGKIMYKMIYIIQTYPGRIMIEKLTDLQLITNIKNKVREEKLIVSEVLQYLEEIDRRKLYVDYGTNSIFKFCTRILKYSDAEAAIRVKVMRVGKKAPIIKPKIKSGEINLSTAATLDTFFAKNKNADKENVINKLVGKTTNESKKILNDLSTNPEPRSLKIILHERILKKIEKIQEDFHDCNELEIIESLIDQHLEAKVYTKVKRKSKTISKNQQYITREIKEYIDHRAQGRCEGISPLSGKRCNSRTNLEYDHIKCMAIGGQSNKNNIRKLCRACNQRAGIKQLGIGKMTPVTVVGFKHGNISKRNNKCHIHSVVQQIFQGK